MPWFPIFSEIMVTPKKQLCQKLFKKIDDKNFMFFFPSRTISAVNNFQEYFTFKHENAS